MTANSSTPASVAPVGKGRGDQLGGSISPEHSAAAIGATGGGGGKILRSTLWTRVRRPDFKGSSRQPGAVQRHAAAPPASARPFGAASDVGCTVG